MIWIGIIVILIALSVLFFVGMILSLEHRVDKLEDELRRLKEGILMNPKLAEALFDELYPSDDLFEGEDYLEPEKA